MLIEDLTKHFEKINRLPLRPKYKLELTSKYTFIPSLDGYSQSTSLEARRCS